MMHLASREGLGIDNKHAETAMNSTQNTIIHWLITFVESRGSLTWIVWLAWHGHVKDRYLRPRISAKPSSDLRANVDKVCRYKVFTNDWPVWAKTSKCSLLLWDVDNLQTSPDKTNSSALYIIIAEKVGATPLECPQPTLPQIFCAPYLSCLHSLTSPSQDQDLVLITFWSGFFFFFFSI